MVLDVERLTDHQIRAANRLDQKAQQMITLGVATVGGSLTLLFVLGEAGGLPRGIGLGALLVAGLAAEIAAIGFFVDAYVGFRTHHEMYPAPGAHWLVSKAADPGWNLGSHLTSLISTYAEYADLNQASMGRSAKARSRGLYALLFGVVVYASTIGFMLKGVVF